MSPHRPSTQRPYPMSPARSRPTLYPPRLIGAALERCLYCESPDIIKKGKRYKKLEIIQLWYCHHCQCVFTPQITKGKTYPLKVILESLMLYYRGETRLHTSERIKERFGIAVPPRTFSKWLAEYRTITTYARLRERCATRFRPSQLIRATRLHHKQVYTYRVHQGKLALILTDKQHAAFSPVATYLTDMAASCPHHLFQTDARASQDKAAYNLDTVEITAKRNHACRMAGLILQTVTYNTRRHDELQRFMLTTDSVTVAVEVPISLTPDDIAHFTRELGFDIPLASTTTLTGHIDVLQIRNGRVHILDYKPGAAKEKPITQLMVYALALSRRTGLRLFDFTCAWFDDHHYFEFYPLHVVHKRGTRRRSR